MNDKDITREHLSALADGELQGEEFARAVAYAGTAEGQSTWRMYHLIGDTLRSPSLAHVTHAADPALVGRLREQLAQEPRPDGVNPAAVATHAVPQGQAEAANASVFRWKLAAGFASIAAVAAVGWQVLMVQAPTAIAPQLAQTAAPNVVAVAAQDGKTVMLRDPNLDALLTLHEQYGTRPSLQVPAEFLRNAGLAHTSAQRTAP